MRLAACAALVVCLGCSGGPVAPARSEAFDADAEQPAGDFTAIGLEAAAALETARAFLEAYERPRTLAATHRRLVDGIDLSEWVYWVGVQNAGLDFVRGGGVEIDGLRISQLRLPFATVAVDAAALTRFRTDGAVGARERRFAALLLQRVESGWRVVDALHDARQMTSTITVFDPPIEVTSDSVDVEVRSVFRFTGGTVVNVSVANRRGVPLEVDLERSLLVVDDEPVRGEQMTRSLMSPVEPGGDAEGGITFPTIPVEAIPQALSLTMRGFGSVNVLAELPAEPFLLDSPAGQSPSNRGGAGSSGM
ncbi:MAG TPA: hypothetical protein VG709_01835 [Actinomycetota bacterium]|nr:hypothetical protein [Actinomycetota bacterium]